MLNIIKLKLLIMMRTEYEVVANKISAFFKHRINPVLIYIIAIIYDLNISLFVCAGIGSLMSPSNVTYIFGFLALFMILNSSAMGRKAARKISSIEQENILLCSSFSDHSILWLLIIEEVISFFIKDLFLFIPSFYMIYYIAHNIVKCIFGIMLFLSINLSVFLISHLKVHYKLNIIKSSSNIVKEMLHILKYGFFTCISFYIFNWLLLSMVKTRVILYSVKDICLNFVNIVNENLGITLKNNFLIGINTVIIYLREKISHGEIAFLSIPLIVLLAVLLIYIFTLNVDLRKAFDCDHNDFNNHSFNIYINILLKLSKIIYPNNFYLKKDLLVLKSKSSLLRDMAVMNYILPISSSINMGFLLCLCVNKVNSDLIYTYIIFFIIVCIADYCMIFTQYFPIALLLNSELRNIQLIKISKTTFLYLVKSKIVLLKLLLIFPLFSIVLQIILLTIIYNKFEPIMFIFYAITLCMFFLLFTHIQIYGNIFFDKYNYSSYEELYEEKMDTRVFRKFFSIPRKLILIPISLLLALNLFVQVVHPLFLQISFYAILYILAAVAGIYLISNIFLKKGVRSLNEKFIQT